MIPNNVGNQEYISAYQNRHIVNGFYPTKHTTDVRARYARLAFGQQDQISKSTRLDPEGYCPTLRAGTGPERVVIKQFALYITITLESLLPERQPVYKGSLIGISYPTQFGTDLGKSGIVSHQLSRSKFYRQSIKN